MSKESEGSKPAPGVSAGDAAPTQAIPRIAKPAGRTSGSAQTDKGRPRPATAGKTERAEKADKSDQADGPTSPPTPPKKRQIEPIGGPTGRPLTAADYARTTQGSASATSVIPAVKDRSRDSSPAQQVMAGDAPAAGSSGRRASLRLTHVDPWSVTRLAFAISVAMMIVAVVAVTIFWFVLDVVGVWDQINDSFTTVLADDTSSFNVTDYFGLSRVVGLTLVLSAVNVVLMTALATIAAHLYNLAAQLMGGVEVTFTEQK